MRPFASIAPADIDTQTSCNRPQPSRNREPSADDYGLGMNTDMRLRVQETLDELLHECLIPFALTAYRVSAEGPGKFLVPLCDSRIHSFCFSWTEDKQSFKKAVRTAVLNRVGSIDNPPVGWPA